jgi:RNA polymerase sigma factor (sigma-70 family)
VEATSAPRPHGLRLPKPRRLLSAFSDERLVEHIRKGDEAAFEILYDRHSAGILGFCTHMLGSSADAEDAVQHTFIAAHSDIGRHGQRNLHVKAWLYTIARNRCLSIMRARREQPGDGVMEVSTDHLLHDIEQREDLRALLADVAKLPGDQREALVLAEIGDLSHSEIGDVLGCEVSKVKSLVFQARSALLDRRAARDTPCAEIREQLATLRGGALRRSQLRHHVEACPGCAEYREQIRRQRTMLALALPVVPSAALRADVLGSLGLGGGSAAAGAGAGAGAGATASAGAGGIAGMAAQGGLAKLGVAVALAAGGAGSAAVVHNNGLPLIHKSNVSHAAPAASTGSSPGVAHTGAAFSGTTTKHGTSTGSHRSASGTQHGFTPVTGESNGARARQFAATRGKGKHTGTTTKHHHVTTQGNANAHKPAHVKHVATPKTPAKPEAKVRTRTAPTHTAPTHTQPAPAPKVKTTPTPTPTATTPAPTTQVDPSIPAPTTTGTGGAGKSLGAGK